MHRHGSGVSAVLLVVTRALRLRPFLLTAVNADDFTPASADGPTGRPWPRDPAHDPITIVALSRLVYRKVHFAGPVTHSFAFFLFPVSFSQIWFWCLPRKMHTHCACLPAYGHGGH